MSNPKRIECRDCKFYWSGSHNAGACKNPKFGGTYSMALSYRADELYCGRIAREFTPKQAKKPSLWQRIFGGGK